MQLLRRLFVSLMTVALSISCATLFAQPVIHHPSSLQSLESKWRWALKEVSDQKLQKGVWIGYAIQRWMGKNSTIGSFDAVSGRTDSSLHERIYGQREEQGDEIGEESVRHEAKRALERANDERSEEKIPKGIAILFGFDPPPGDFTQPRKIVVANLSMSIDLSDRPLIWLGRAQDEESVLFLEQFFINVKSIKLKERLLFAISIHDSSERAQKILRDLVVQSDHERLRASAAFFLGERNRDEDISLLQKVILHDRSREVREKAVFGLSRMESDAAVDALIALARHGEETDMKEKALFWLSEKASERVVPTLREIAAGDQEIEIQRQAVFALSRLKHGDGVKELIEIAKNHKVPEIRRQAIFWLGRSEDDRAIDFLVELVRRK